MAGKIQESTFSFLLVGSAFKLYFENDGHDANQANNLLLG